MMWSSLRILSTALVSCVVASCASGGDVGETAPPHHVDKFDTGGASGSTSTSAGGQANLAGSSGHVAAGGSTGGGGSAGAGAGLGGKSAGAGGSSGSTSASGAGGSVGGGSSGGAGGGASATCSTTFTFHGTASSVVAAGEWNGFDMAKATTLTKDASGAFSGEVPLAPGLWAYKLIVDGQWQLDPGQGRRKWIKGEENSAMKVVDCAGPSLVVATSLATFGTSNASTYAATLSYVDGVDHAGADPSAFSAVLMHDSVASPLTSGVTVAPTGDVTIALSSLAPGKYSVLVRPASKTTQGNEARLVFWIEEKPFQWDDALIYMAVTDRFRDGDPTNDPPKTSGVDPRADFQGGDLAGVKQAIDDGTLDKLGVRALWLTPFHTNPPDAFAAADGVHQTMGYHGYWPIKGREVDARLGGADALHALVTSAHAHGIRILQDYVVNHVHEEHEYFKAHPEWFRTGCVCGTANCDWTTHAVDCLFAPYMPDVNHTVPEATAQLVSDAVYWLDTFDLDGLRVDAVKHVEEAATRNLAAEVREQFQQAGNRYFMMGETAMGWDDCNSSDPTCNADNYGTIAKYIGPLGLDGQFDFVLYHAVSYRAFAWQDKGFLHADYWFQHGQAQWPAGAIMTPYIGSHDTSRFVSFASYGSSDGTPNNQWDNAAGPPAAGNSEPYARARLAFAWLLALPGAPLMYYGDEYGQWGGADPNNRMMMRAESSLSGDEAATLAFVRKTGLARRDIEALRRGAYVPFSATTDDLFVFGRKTSDGQSALVVMSRLTTPTSVTVDVAGTLGFAASSTLHDALSGATFQVGADGKLTVALTGKTAVVLAP